MTAVRVSIEIADTLAEIVATGGTKFGAAYELELLEVGQVGKAVEKTLQLNVPGYNGQHEARVLGLMPKDDSYCHNCGGESYHHSTECYTGQTQK